MSEDGMSIEKENVILRVALNDIKNMFLSRIEIDELRLSVCSAENIELIKSDIKFSRDIINVINNIPFKLLNKDLLAKVYAHMMD